MKTKSMIFISRFARRIEAERSPLQAGPWTCRVRSSEATASEQRGHWLNMDLLSHSPRRCSVRLAISTTCGHEAEVPLVSQGGLRARRHLWEGKRLPVDIRRIASAWDSVSSSEGPIRPLWMTHPFSRRIYTGWNGGEKNAPSMKAENNRPVMSASTCRVATLLQSTWFKTSPLRLLLVQVVDGWLDVNTVCHLVLRHFCGSWE